MTVKKLAVWLPVLDEDIVDYGMGTPEQQAAAAARIEVRRAETHARWNALPWWERRRRSTVYSRRVYEWPRRIALAWDALRGRHECDP